MGLKARLIRPYARRIVKRLRRSTDRAFDCQQEIFEALVAKGRNTRFGRDHGLADVRDHREFTTAVPLRGYEEIKPYVQMIKEGDRDVLWPGVPRYFAKTSGTTSGVKYIPITAESLPYHVNTARNALFHYFIDTGKGSYFDGKMLYLSGSPEMDTIQGIETGRLSGIVNHQIPTWAKRNKLPSHAVNCITDWESKVAAIVDESIHTDLRLIGGIPPWVQMYFEAVLARSGKSSVKEVFPNLDLFVYGGVNYEPYRAKLEELIGESIDSIETFPASEGFFAFQYKQGHPGLLLNVDAGMFYEFVPVEEIHAAQPTRLTLAEVVVDQQYALIVNSNAGLWAYNIGDTVKFVSLEPPQIVVTGRIKHYISAFGEHVIGREVEVALLEATNLCGGTATEFTVAPQVNPAQGLPYHEWLIEFGDMPADLAAFADALDQSMQRQNIYYKDLIEGRILRPVKITPLKAGAFRQYMESLGKLGGQNKVPRLTNDRRIADALAIYLS